MPALARGLLLLACAVFLSAGLGCQYQPSPVLLLPGASPAPAATPSGSDLERLPGPGLAIFTTPTPPAATPAVLPPAQSDVAAALLLPDSPPVVREITLVVQAPDTTRRIDVDPATLRQWLDLRSVPTGDGGLQPMARLRRQPAAAYLETLAGVFSRPVRDGALSYNALTGQLSVLTSSQIGQELDIGGSLDAIQMALAAGQATVDLPLKTTRPRVDASDLAGMGIKELISQATTDFAGSPWGRVQNITVAAARFQNLVVAPGEEFSFLQHLGEISGALGYTYAAVISGGRTELGLGGGVCQVSTTAFRAAYFGGFPITERWPHSYVVSWYGEPGLDATIFAPKVDFRFRNDTGHYLLIQTLVDADQGHLTFYFYGTKPARTVDPGKPLVTGWYAAPPPLYQEAPSLAKGTIEQVDWAVAGMNVLVTRRIAYGDGSVREDRFESRYQPWRAVFLYGPGTELPAGVLEAAKPAAPQP